ncbi:MAG: hypothetical protein EXS19_00465 [Pedosphaera sp.]|nr:hypothetical protein [Pedosphaera sp.]
MNRKKQSTAVRFGPAIKAFLLCVVICGSGLGYVWQKQQIVALGRQIKQGETRLEELRRENKQRGDALAWLRSPQALDARVRELKLGLVLPQPEQVVLMLEQMIQSQPIAQQRVEKPALAAKR